MKKLTKDGFIEVNSEQLLTLVCKISYSRLNKYRCGYCGIIVDIPSDWVSRKKNPVKSCGCIRTKSISTDHKDYNIWVKMRLRCHDSNNIKYVDYGKRGISVCDRWFNSFEMFIFDMGERPDVSYSIERVDVNGNYEQSNCIWLLKSRQANNKRRTRYLEYNNTRLSVADWSRDTGISVKLICQRMDRDKKSIGEALGYE